MSNDFQTGSRSGYRAKRKKTNLILNSLIVIVLALIVIVAYSIFSSGDEKASSKNEPKTEEKQTNNKDDETKENKEKQTEEKQSAKEEEDLEVEEKEDKSVSEEADNSEAVVTAGDGTSNVVKTIENPTWKPVGTEQTGVHNPVYDDTSVDWQEMLKAISYATGIDQSTMTVYWLGRDQSTTNGSVGTVYSKETEEKYRVYIQWIDGQGWMPSKVEELAELQR